jgi:hypothetical protein
MTDVQLLIPTLDRDAQLQTVLRSVVGATPVISHETSARGYILAMNELIANSTADVIICGNDDAVFHPDTITRVVQLLLDTYPDGDGIIGIHTENALENQHGGEFAFPAIGRKYLRRFPRMHFLCPDYLHWYGDTEMGAYAEQIGRFFCDPSIAVFHDRPWPPTEQTDSTRTAAFQMIQADQLTRKLRETNNYLWGENMDLVNPGHVSGVITAAGRGEPRDARADIPARSIPRDAFVAIVGTQSSGSSAVAGVLYHLGLFLGNKFEGRYGNNPDTSCGFEAVGLALICKTSIPELCTSFVVSPEKAEKQLQAWILARVAEARNKGLIAGGKNPGLCRMGDFLQRICGDKLLVVNCERPLEESIRSLTRIKQTDGTAALDVPRVREHQEWLYAGKARLLQEIPADRQITVDHEQLLQDPRREVLRLTTFLNLKPTPAQIEKACNCIKPKERHADLSQASTTLSPAPSIDIPPVFCSFPANTAAILTCVEFDDILKITLPRNSRHFSRIMIVTSPDDLKTQEVARSVPNAELFITDAFTRRGASFNKGLALEEALDALNHSGWLTIMDCDIIMPQALPEHAYTAGNMYAPKRHLLEDASLFSDNLSWDTVAMKDEIVGIGYFQMFHTADPVVADRPWYVTNFLDAGGSDTTLPARWPSDRLLRPPFHVLHLGPIAHNWFGRITPRLGTSELPKEALDRHAKFQKLNFSMWAGIPRPTVDGAEANAGYQPPRKKH